MRFCLQKKEKDDRTKDRNENTCIEESGVLVLSLKELFFPLAIPLLGHQRSSLSRSTEHLPLTQVLVSFGVDRSLSRSLSVQNSSNCTLRLPIPHERFHGYRCHTQQWQEDAEGWQCASKLQSAASPRSVVSRCCSANVTFTRRGPAAWRGGPPPFTNSHQNNRNQPSSQPTHSFPLLPQHQADRGIQNMEPALVRTTCLPYLLLLSLLYPASCSLCRTHTSSSTPRMVLGTPVFSYPLTRKDGASHLRTTRISPVPTRSHRTRCIFQVFKLLIGSPATPQTAMVPRRVRFKLVTIPVSLLLTHSARLSSVSDGCGYQSVGQEPAGTRTAGMDS